MVGDVWSLKVHFNIKHVCLEFVLLKFDLFYNDVFNIEIHDIGVHHTWFVSVLLLKITDLLFSIYTQKVIPLTFWVFYVPISVCTSTFCLDFHSKMDHLWLNHESRKYYRAFVVLGTTYEHINKIHADKTTYGKR